MQICWKSQMPAQPVDAHKRVWLMRGRRVIMPAVGSRAALVIGSPVAFKAQPWAVVRPN